MNKLKLWKSFFVLTVILCSVGFIMLFRLNHGDPEKNYSMTEWYDTCSIFWGVFLILSPGLVFSIKKELVSGSIKDAYFKIIIYLLSSLLTIFIIFLGLSFYLDKKISTANEINDAHTEICKSIFTDTQKIDDCVNGTGISCIGDIDLRNVNKTIEKYKNTANRDILTQCMNNNKYEWLADANRERFIKYVSNLDGRKEHYRAICLMYLYILLGLFAVSGTYWGTRKWLKWVKQ